MNVRSCACSIHPGSVVLGILLLAANPGLAQAPKINPSLDDAIRQIERQAQDFKTTMARIEMIRAAEGWIAYSN